MPNQKVAVITGASSGIGKATFNLFNQTGIHTIGLSRHIQEGDVTKKCDVSDPQAVDKVFGEIEKKFGSIDILVNSAAIVSTTPLLEVDVKEWQEMMMINVVGTYHCSRQAAIGMKNRKYGKIINVASIAGRSFSQSASVSYTASKYAVVGMTRQMAAHLGEFGINVNCVCPSHTKTEMLMNNVSEEKQQGIARMVPLKRLAEPIEIANVIAFLASDASSYMNGSILDVNGGQL